MLFDTSVIVAALVAGHVHHARASAWLRRAHSPELQLVVATHTLAELYSVLTALPSRPRISPREAFSLIQENVERHARLVSLSEADYTATLRDLAARSLAGGVVFDALLVRAARNAEVDQLLTLNLSDFRRIWPEGEGILIEP